MKSSKEQIADILGWTPEFLESMKEVMAGCVCELEPADKMFNDKLDRIMAVVDQARKEGEAKGIRETADAMLEAAELYYQDEFGMAADDIRSGALNILRATHDELTKGV